MTPSTPGANGSLCMASEGTRHRTLVFVCLHGVARSRVAGAFFNRVAPSGWSALSAGLEPQAQMTDTAAVLLKGTGAEEYLDLSPPRPVDAVRDAELLVAIDCELPDSKSWRLIHQDFGSPMRGGLTA